uniref:Uncharacterized protein n=1 Tax=Zosterops lateralis melanops TaxID=1220523 RepID=A0A8D2PD46_ZOSLA
MTTEKSPAADADNSEQQQAKEEGAAETQKQEASLEEGAQPTPERQPQRQKASNGDTPTHEEQSKKEHRTSEGRGLSRLFSSFLRRPKSQVSEEDKDTDAAKEAGGDQDAGLGASPDEDILVKAPIAAPEPELKTDPSLDLHSLSSAETQYIDLGMDFFNFKEGKHDILGFGHLLGLGCAESAKYKCFLLMHHVDRNFSTARGLSQLLGRI